MYNIHFVRGAHEFLKKMNFRAAGKWMQPPKHIHFPKHTRTHTIHDGIERVPQFEWKSQLCSTSHVYLQHFSSFQHALIPILNVSWVWLDLTHESMLSSYTLRRLLHPAEPNESSFFLLFSMCADVVEYLLLLIGLACFLFSFFPFSQWREHFSSLFFLFFRLALCCFDLICACEKQIRHNKWQ